ncbi:MAG: helix-turn-helix transcriptional regulator [Pseudomonadota bacterium]
MPRTPVLQEITADLLRRIRGTRPEILLSAPKNIAMARGAITVHSLRDGVTVMRGRMRGLREMYAHPTGDAGVHIETRLHGHSRSWRDEVDDWGFCISGGEMRIAGLTAPTRYSVHIPSQARFEAVSICYPSAFIEKIASSEPQLASRLRSIQEGDRGETRALSSQLRYLAQEILEIDGHAPLDALRFEQLAMAYLIAAMETEEAGAFQATAGPLVPQIESIIGSEGPRIWTVAALADALGLSQARIKRAVLRETGRPIGAYLAERRLSIACEMLRGRQSVAEIAAATGYSSAEAFTKAFRKRFGISPRDYRASQI